MLNALLADVKLAAAQTQASLADSIRRAVLSMVGGVLLVVGVAFLTTALWILLERHWSNLVAATVVAALYMAVGLIFLLMSRGRRPIPVAPPAAAAAVPPSGRVPPGSPFGSPIPPTSSVVPPLVEAFLFGLNTARAPRPSRPRRGRRYEYRDDEW